MGLACEKPVSGAARTKALSDLHGKIGNVFAFDINRIEISNDK